MGDNTNILVLRLQDRALFNVQLKERMHFARANLLVTPPADPCQFIAEFFAIGIFNIVSPFLFVHAGKNARGHHRRGVPCAFFVGPVGHHNRVFGFDVQIIQRADNFKAAKHAQNAIVLAPGWLGIKM